MVLGTLLTQLLGLILYGGFLVLIIFVVITLVAIRKNSEETNRRLAAIEQHVAELAHQKKE